MLKKLKHEKQERREIFHSRNDTHIFKVVKHSERDNIIDKILSNPSSICLSAHNVYDKILKNYIIGVSRSYITK